MISKTKKRTYGISSYADAYFWSRCPALKSEVAQAIGDEYVNTDTQLGNIWNRLKDLGETKIATRLRKQWEGAA